MVRQHENSVCESLHEQLHDVDSFAFEHLIKRLLEEIDYLDVELTARSSNGGEPTFETPAEPDQHPFDGFQSPATGPACAAV